MTPIKKVRVYWHPDAAGYCLEFPFDQRFIDGLKHFIPYSYRTYDSTTKIWAVAESHLETVLELMRHMEWKPTVVTRKEVEEKNPYHGDVPLEKVALAFFQLVPQDVMTKAYKHAALMLHPDRGGNGTDMAALNAAWTRLQEVYA